MPTQRFLVAVFASLTGVVIASHVLGATVFRHVLWGAHFYGFFPPPLLMIALALLVGVSAFAWLRPPGSGAANADPSRGARLVLALALPALGLFWWLRIRHTLLGDSGPLSHNLPLGESTHPRQPLSLFIHHHLYLWTRSWFEAPGRDPQSVASDTVAFGSAVAGALFVPVAFALARHLIARPASDADPESSGATNFTTVTLAALLLMTQGYMQLFFGYVENYTWFTLAMAAYLWAGMSFVAGRAPLMLASLALACAVGLNLSGVALLPSLGALAAWGFTRPERRWAVARDLGLTVGVFLALQALLASFGGYSTREGLRYMWDLVMRGEATNRSLAYLFSNAHWRDFYNVQLLIGPFAGFLLAPVAVLRLVAPGRKDARLLFLFTAALPALAAAWMYGDSIQGIPRDWDLFAPFALVFTAAAIYAVASAPLSIAMLHRLLAIAATVSLFHTGSWIAINTSVGRSLERYKTLPTSRGRTQMVVGYWYLTHGQKALAREWFERAVAAYPGNNLAQNQLGLYAMDDGRYADAARHFEIAVRSRPDKTNYRAALVDALVLGGRPQQAADHLEVLTQALPSRPEVWGCYGIVLTGLGRLEEARAALARAREIAPTDPRFPKLQARLGQPDAYARDVTEDWDRLVLQLE